jgi:hypothetical protein
MSEVEALLSVDAGRVPRGTTAFFLRDPEAPRRRSYAWLALIVEGFALSLVVTDASRVGAALLALAGVVLTLWALPTHAEEDDRPRKQPTLLVTADGIVVRDSRGMRSWHFDDLAEVGPYTHSDSQGLLIVRKNGKRDFVDTTPFERGEKVGDAVGRRWRLRTALPIGAVRA